MYTAWVTGLHGNGARAQRLGSPLSTDQSGGISRQPFTHADRLTGDLLQPLGARHPLKHNGVFHAYSGNHEMMAKQVKPISHRERKACQTDNAPASEFHQGQRLLASIKSPDLWLQSSPAYYHRLRAWQNRGDHLCVKTSKPV